MLKSILLATDGSEAAAHDVEFNGLGVAVRPALTAKRTGVSLDFLFIVEPFSAFATVVALGLHAWLVPRTVYMRGIGTGRSIRRFATYLAQRNGARGSHARRLRCSAPGQRIRSSRSAHFLRAAPHIKPARREHPGGQEQQMLPVDFDREQRACQKGINRRLKDGFRTIRWTCFSCCWSLRQVIGSAGSSTKALNEIPGAESRPVRCLQERRQAHWPAKRWGAGSLEGFLHNFAGVPRMYLAEVV